MDGLPSPSTHSLLTESGGYTIWSCWIRTFQLISVSPQNIRGAAWVLTYTTIKHLSSPPTPHFYQRRCAQIRLSLQFWPGTNSHSFKTGMMGMEILRGYYYILSILISSLCWYWAIMYITYSPSTYHCLQIMRDQMLWLNQDTSADSQEAHKHHIRHNMCGYVDWVLPHLPFTFPKSLTALVMDYNEWSSITLNTSLFTREEDTR